MPEWLYRASGGQLSLFMAKPQVRTLHRKPDESAETNIHEDAIKACASDLIDAVHKKDTEAAAKALRSLFEIQEAIPHEEGPHETGFEMKSNLGEE